MDFDKFMPVEKTHQVQENDIILMYSDGFSKNIFPEKYADCLKPYLNSDNKLENISGAALC